MKHTTREAAAATTKIDKNKEYLTELTSFMSVWCCKSIPSENRTRLRGTQMFWKYKTENENHWRKWKPLEKICNREEERVNEVNEKPMGWQNKAEVTKWYLI